MFDTSLLYMCDTALIILNCNLKLFIEIHCMYMYMHILCWYLLKHVNAITLVLDLSVFLTFRNRFGHTGCGNRNRFGHTGSNIRNRLGFTGCKVRKWIGFTNITRQVFRRSQYLFQQVSFTAALHIKIISFSGLHDENEKSYSLRFAAFIIPTIDVSITDHIYIYVFKILDYISMLAW